MSALFGMFSRSGQPVEPADLQRMADAIPWYGLDGGGRWCSGPVALGHLLRCVTPESRCERQPLVDATGMTVLAADARLDNRAELINRLKLRSPTSNPVTDADLILAAYAAWGEACPAALLGDFAFVLWDGADRKLVCARDPIGVAPFYYHLGADWFVFGSDLRAVAAHPAVPDGLNDVAVAMHLSRAQYVLPTMTFLAAVQKLPPARVLTVTAERIRQRPYWSPDQVPAVRLPTDTAYAERMRELFEQAVNCRLRSIHPVAAHMSGGLDSTAIAAQAARHLQAEGSDLPTYNWLPTPRAGDDPAAPEYAALRRASAALGLSTENVDLTEAGLVAALDTDISLDAYTDLWYEPLVRRRARVRGVRVMLSGWGGDEVVTANSRGYPAELLRRGRWRRLAWLVAARTDGSPGRCRSALGLLHGQALLPLLPDRLHRLLVRRQPQPLETCLAPPFSAFVRQHLAQNGYLEGGGVGLHAEQARRLSAGHLQQRIEAWACQGARDGIVYRYPLLDRRLIEFCLGVPADLFVTERHSRCLFRLATEGLLPEETRWGSFKYEPLRVARYLELMEAACRRWLAAAACSSKTRDLAGARKYLDLERLWAQTERAAPAPAQGEKIGRVIALERQIQVLVMSGSRPALAVRQGR